MPFECLSAQKPSHLLVCVVHVELPREVAPMQVRTRLCCHGYCTISACRFVPFTTLGRHSRAGLR